MFMSVFSFVAVAGVDCWITVVLLSFFSAGGLVTVVSFCSQPANSATPASRQMYFFIPLIRMSARSLAALPDVVFFQFATCVRDASDPGSACELFIAMNK